MMPPQNESEVLDLIRAMESAYAEAFKAFEEDVKFYEGQLEDFIEVPEGFDVTIPSTPRAVIDEAVDNAVPSDIRFNYPPRGKRKKHEEDADAIRRFARGLWQFWRFRGGDIDVLRDFMKNLFMSGKACFKVAPDWTLWPQLSPEEESSLRARGREALSERVSMIEKIRKENFPIFCRSIAPSCIMEDPTLGPRKLWVIERYQSSPAEVCNYYGKYLAEYSSSYYHVGVPVHEVWTASYVDWNGRLVQGKRYVFVNYELVEESDNPYHEVPYCIKYSGYGREAYEGRPEFKSVGFFTRQNKSLFLAEMRRFTQLDAIMQSVAFPVAFVPETLSNGEVDFSPGNVNFIPDDLMQYVRNIWLTPQIPSAEYINSLGAISSQIERGTVQKALRGQNIGGVESAAQYNLLSNQARLRIESVVQASQDAVSWATEMALKYIDVILQDSVSVFVGEGNSGGYYEIGPNQIDGHYRISAEFIPNEEALKERKLILASDAISKGILSRWDAYTYAGFDNPWELIERRNADELMQEPIIKRALAKRVLKEWGEDADQLELEERMQQAENQWKLSQYAQQLQIGTPRGGEPMSPDGNPVNAMPIPPAAAPEATPFGPGGGFGPEPPGGPQAAPPPGAGSVPTMPGGAPAAVQASPVSGLVRDLKFLGAR